MQPEITETDVATAVLQGALLDFSETTFSDQLKQTNNLRSQLVNLLISNKSILNDPKMLGIVDKFTKGIDSATLGQMRLIQEKDKSDEDQNIQRAYVMLMQRQGKNFTRGYELGSPEGRVLEPEIDGSQFTFIPGEESIGNDIKEE